jgi:hypothetical protein
MDTHRYLELWLATGTVAVIGTEMTASPFPVATALCVTSINLSRESWSARGAVALDAFLKGLQHRHYG